MTDWVQVQPPHTDRIVEGVIHKYIRDLQGDLIAVDGLAKRMPEIAQNAVIVYKHGRDPQRGVVPLGRICAWKHMGDEIHIQAAFNKGNEIVDAIWKEEVVPLGTRAGFSIGGGTRAEHKACRLEAGARMCDISDVIVCEVSWTPSPANPGARITRVNTLAKAEEDLEKDGGFLAPEGSRCGARHWNTGHTCTRERGHAAGHVAHRGVTGGKFHTTFTENEVSKSEEPAEKQGAAIAMAAIQGVAGAAAGGGGSAGSTEGPKGKVGEDEEKSLDKALWSPSLGWKQVAQLEKAPVPVVEKCHCGKEDCEKCKKELTITKAVEKGLEDSLLALYRQLPERAMAEVALQGCGTCDDYVTHKVRERHQSASMAVLSLQNVLDKAHELYQKDALQKGGTMPDEKKELPKETDGEDKVRKALEERIVALEKQVAALSGVNKESAGFAEAKIGIGEGPLAGVQTQAPPSIDMTNMATTKDLDEAIVKVVKAGLKVEGYQKGVAQNVPPKAPTAPAGVDKEVFQKMAESDPNVKSVLAWAQNKQVR